MASLNIEKKYLSFLLKDPKYLEKARQQMKPEYLADEKCRTLCEIIYDYYDKYKETPTDLAFKDNMDKIFADKPTEVEFYLLFASQLKNKDINETDFEFVVDSIIDAYLKDVLLKNLNTTVDDLDKKNIRDVYDDLHKGINTAKNINKLKRQEQPVRLWGLKELLNENNLEVEWLVDKLIEKDSMTILHSNPKVGKTWISLNLAVALSSGNKYLNEFTVPCPIKVLYVSEEDNIKRIGQRLKLLPNMNNNYEVLDQNLKFAIHENINVIDNEKLQDLINVHLPEVVIIDSLSRIHSLKENDEGDMKRLMSKLEEIKRQYKISFVLIHHSRKENNKGGYSGSSMRGSSVIWAWVDGRIELNKRGKGLIEVMLEGKNIESFKFGIEFNIDKEKAEFEYKDIEDERKKQKEKEDQIIIDFLKQDPSKAVVIKDIMIETKLSEDKIYRLLKELMQDGKVKPAGKIGKANAFIIDNSAEVFIKCDAEKEKK